MEAPRQDAGHVFKEAAAGDVGQRVDAARSDEGQQALHIDAGGLDQVVDQQALVVEQGRAVELPALVGGEAAHQRIAVGVDARGGEADQHIAFRHAVARQLLAALDRADAEARKVVVAGRVHAGHFRRLAADQRAAGHAAAFGDAGNDPLGNARIELAGGEIIKEEQGLGTLNDEIVDAHGDQIDADGVMPVMVDGELDLGADAVVAGDQQRVLVAGGLQIEERAETAEFGVRAGARCHPRERADRLDQRVAGGDVYPRLGVGIGLRSFVG